MSNALHRNTPTLTAIDPRGLAVRTVQYHRATLAHSPQPRVNRQVFGASGFLLEQWDPRQFALGSTGVAAQSNLYSLSGEAVRTLSADAGWRVIRPPHLPLSQDQADKVWAAWSAAGAIPLPGLSSAKAAAE